MLRVETLAAPGTAAATHSLPDEKAGTRLESWLVVLITLLMVLLTTLEPIARRLGFANSAVWQTYTQHLTLWLGFLGALLAAASEKHLALSTVDMLPEGRPRIAALTFGHFSSAAICAVLALASLNMVLAEMDHGSPPRSGYPDWYVATIMPIGFAAMAVRFAWKTPGGLRARLACLAPVVAVAVLALLLVTKTMGPDAGAAWVAAHPKALVIPGSLLLTVAFLLGTPVFVVMAGFALLLFFQGGTPIAAVPAETFRLVVSPTLPAIPLLTLAGYVLAEGGAGERLVRAAQSIFGWMPGGLAVMAVFVCAIFTTFTGGSGITILALGGLLLPMLVKEGYPEGFSLGLVTASGSLGLLFPPSLPVILYGVVAQTPIDHLYIGGLVPGLLMIVLVAAYGVVAGIRGHVPRPKFDGMQALRALWSAKWDLGLPVVVVVALGSGFATIVESAAMGAAYAIIVELIVFRDIHPVRDLPRVIVHTATLVGSVVILLGVAMGLTSYLVDADIPTALLSWVQTHIKHQWQFLLALNVILLVLGSVLEIYSAIVVLAPLVAPLGKAFGVDPVHLGVVFLANLELGFLFPPMGLNLFLSASRFQKPLPLVYRKAFPFLIIMSVGVLLVTYIEAITTGVVHLIKR